jgi:hypothetical protein
VVFLDEIDALPARVLISRPPPAPRRLPPTPARLPLLARLVGLRDVRDYKVAPGPGSELDRGLHLGTASPFNIKVRSLTMRDFTEAEVAELYAQHTAETGQVFTPEACRGAFELTQGQPWLVNALAKEAVEELVPDRAQPITAADVDRAKEALIRRQDTHLDSLAERLREPRVRQIIEPILAGEPCRRPRGRPALRHRPRPRAPKPEGGLVIANPIYREVIPRALASGIPSASLPQIPRRGSPPRAASTPRACSTPSSPSGGSTASPSCALRPTTRSPRTS